jgi:shikimate kinase
VTREFVNIVLIGYRGTGKSSVSRLLSTVLGMELVEMDRLIVERAKLSIPQMVEIFGWDRFRDLESEVAREISQRDDCVIDAGGGVVLREENVEYLKTNGLFFWLKARKETIIERIKDGEERPSLIGIKSFVDEVEEVLKFRDPLYQAAADWVIETDEKSMGEVSAEIIKTLLQVDELDDLNVRLEEGLKKIEEVEQDI